MKITLTHPSCRASFREDMRHGLIYGPYAIHTGKLETCPSCNGAGSYANYSNDAINGDLAGKPAPCPTCQGKGKREAFRIVTMAEWAREANLCVYCGHALRGRSRNKKG